MPLRTSRSPEVVAPVSRFPYERLGDAELVEAVAHGDSQAVAVVWDRYSPLVRSVVRASLGPDSATEDLLQDVFVAFLRSVDTLRNASALRGFLIGVTVRLVALELRRRKIRRWVSLSPSGSLPEMPVAPRDVEGREALEALYRLLGRMPNRRRLAFVLRVVQGCEILEVASALGVSDSTAKREVLRAQDQLLRQAGREPALLHYMEKAMGGGMGNWREQLDQLSAIGTLVRESVATPVSDEVHSEGRERLVATAVAQRYATRPRRRATIAFAAAAVLVGGLATWRLWPKPLSYEVRGGSGFDGPYVSASPLSPAELLFSDGSNLQADPGCRLRVDETYRNGARVFVERGQATSKVTHDKASNWTFVAGPFEVHVTGTRFALNWDPLFEEFDLHLLEGSVEVRSPLAQGPIVVRAGQRFRATVASRSLMVTEGETVVPVTPAAPPPESAPSHIVTAPPPPPAAAPVVAPPVSNKTVARRDSWQELLTRGDFESIVIGANARGLDTCINNCPAGDLRSLADAARYTGRGELAEKCLLALRRRFPKDGHAAAAAFMLGRTQETRNQPTSAQKWYETYLAESPDGEFAAEALAGKMRAVTTTRGPASAKPLALEYLRRYPQGVHVKTARKIAGME